MSSNMSKPAKKAGAVLMMGTLCAVSIFSVKTFARDVYVNVDNSTIHSITFDTNVNSILDKVGVEISNDDVIETIDDTDGSLKLNVKRAFDVGIQDGNKNFKLKVVGGKVSDALEMFGINLDKHDIINLSLDSELKKDMQIKINRRVKIFILADGEEKEYIIPKNYTVKDALKYAKINLSENDIITSDLSEKVCEDMKITINRIRFEEIINTEIIPKNTVVKSTDTLDEGTQEISSEGQDGKKEIKIKNTIKDNEIIDSEVLSTEIVQEPIDKVVLKGTRKKPSVSNSKETRQNKSYGTVLTGSATAYTASSGARTSTGAKPVQGITVAVNPSLIPYGSKVRIESEDGSFSQTLIAQDTGGALKSNKALADIYMDSKDACKKFGRKKITLSIIS